jgi:hypothetical protein
VGILGSQHHEDITSARWLAGLTQELTDRHAQRPPRSGFVLVGDTSPTFWRSLEAAPNREFEEVADGYAVIQDFNPILGGR